MKIKNILLIFSVLGFFCSFNLDAKKEKKHKKNKHKIERVKKESKEKRDTIKEWDEPAIKGKMEEKPFPGIRNLRE